MHPEVGRASKKAFMSFTASVCPYDTAASSVTVLCLSLRTAFFFKKIQLIYLASRSCACHTRNKKDINLCLQKNLTGTEEDFNERKPKKKCDENHKRIYNFFLRFEARHPKRVFRRGLLVVSAHIGICRSFFI